MRFLCDKSRHLICIPYSVENLHEMAKTLGINRCWFHNTPNFPHYDIPKRMISEIEEKCELVTTRDIVRIIKDATKNKQPV